MKIKYQYWHIHVEHLEQCLAQSKNSENVHYYYYYYLFSSQFYVQETTCSKLCEGSILGTEGYGE